MGADHLTAVGAVDLIVTNLAAIQVTPAGLLLKELAHGARTHPRAGPAGDGAVGAERKGTQHQVAVLCPSPRACISSSFRAFLTTLPVRVLGRSSRNFTSRGAL